MKTFEFMSKIVIMSATALALTTLSACASNSQKDQKASPIAMTQPTLLQSSTPFKVGEIQPTKELVEQFERAARPSSLSDIQVQKITPQKDGSTKVLVAIASQDKTQTTEFTLSSSESAKFNLKEKQKLRAEKTGYGYALMADKTMVAAMVRK